MQFDIQYVRFTSVELAKRHWEVQAVEEYSDRVLHLEDLVRENEKMLQLRAQQTKRAENKAWKPQAVKKPVQLLS